MGFCRIHSGAVSGTEAKSVQVEVNIDSRGFPVFNLVGLPSKEVDEAKERVRTALKNSGYKFPSKKITINLAPADLKKKGSLFDAPIALGILCVEEGLVLNRVSSKCLVIGELSLNGQSKGVDSAFAFGLLAKSGNDFEYLFLPDENYKDINIISGLKIFLYKDLRDLFEKYKRVNVGKINFIQTKGLKINEKVDQKSFDLWNSIKGQEMAKRAIEISLAGGHHLMMIGPPGAGKSLLAEAAIGHLPKLTEGEFLELNKIYSISRLSAQESRPFRAVHHSASVTSMIGGGRPFRFGEISLAHRGVLFLDEFSEFNHSVIESLRVVLESGEINFNRSDFKEKVMARFIFWGAMNPCPCGYFGEVNNDGSKRCGCRPFEIKRHLKNLSGPIRDRVDLFVYCNDVEVESLKDNRSDMTAEYIKKRIEKARELQIHRYSDIEGELLNANLQVDHFDKKLMFVKDFPSDYLIKMKENLNLSMRSFYKVQRVARTIADLEGVEFIYQRHIEEALQFRGNISI